MPNLGSGLSLGTLSRLSSSVTGTTYDFDTSVYATSTGVDGTNNFKNYSNVNSGFFKISSSSYASCAGSNLNITSSGFTLSTWIRPTEIYRISKTGTGPTGFSINNSVLFSKGEYNVNGWYVNLQTNTSYFTPRFVVNSAGATSGIEYNGSINISNSVNSWIHLAVTYNKQNGEAIMYWNGTQVNKLTLAVTPLDNTNEFRVGRGNGNDSSLYYDGSIEETGIWNRILSANEISYLYNSGNGIHFSELSNSVKTNLISYWTFDDAGSTAIADQGSGLNNLIPSNVSSNSKNAGITESMNPLALIDSFVTQVKLAGLWSNLLFIPLRKGFSSPSGTGYCLGGLVSNTYSFYNSPTLYDKGMQFKKGQYVGITGRSFTSPGTIGACVTPNWYKSGTGGSIDQFEIDISGIMGDSSSKSQSFQISQNASGNGSERDLVALGIDYSVGNVNGWPIRYFSNLTGSFDGGAVPSYRNSFISWSTTDGTTITNTRNGSLITNQNINSTSLSINDAMFSTGVRNFSFGSVNGSAMQDASSADVSFVFMSNGGALTTAQISALYNIYKATIGYGLRF